MGLLVGAAGADQGPDQGPDRGADQGGKRVAQRVLEYWRRIGVPPRAEQIVITPACGLAGRTPAQLLATLKQCREAAAILPEMIGDLK